MRSPRFLVGVLRGQSLTEFSVEERMSWAAKRTTTLKEDKVYCLLGIFGVFLSLIYGEGEALRDSTAERGDTEAAGRAGEQKSLQDLPVCSASRQSSISLYKLIQLTMT